MACLRRRGISAFFLQYTCITCLLCPMYLQPYMCLGWSRISLKNSRGTNLTQFFKYLKFREISWNISEDSANINVDQMIVGCRGIFRRRKFIFPLERFVCIKFRVFFCTSAALQRTALGTGPFRWQPRSELTEFTMVWSNGECPDSNPGLLTILPLCRMKLTDSIRKIQTKIFRKQ